MLLSIINSSAATQQRICGNIQKYLKITWILNIYKCSLWEAWSALPTSNNQTCTQKTRKDNIHQKLGDNSQFSWKNLFGGHLVQPCASSRQIDPGSTLGWWKTSLFSTSWTPWPSAGHGRDNPLFWQESPGVCFGAVSVSTRSSEAPHLCLP